MMRKICKTLFLGLLLFKVSFALAQRTPLEEAKWITPGPAEPAKNRPVPIFRKSWNENKKVQKAMLTITAHGLYEVDINRKRVGDAYFTPGYTAYEKRLQYQQYDITRLLAKTNEIQVSLGEGWWKWTFGQQQANALLCTIYIVYTDGTVGQIFSDESWQVGTGQILASDIYNGEDQDTRLAPGNWHRAEVASYNKASLVATTGTPVRKMESFKPKRIWTDGHGARVVDFGQNMAGWATLKLKGRAGDTVRIYYGETLDKNGDFYNGNLRAAKATDLFVLNGQEQLLEPHFTYHGFQYIKLTGVDPTQVEVRAYALYSDLQSTGNFACSNLMLNQLQSNILWSMKGNFFDLPTDCPQRSERLGWTLDADVFCGTACYLMNVQQFYSKWLKDLAAEQKPNGAVPVTVPVLGFDHSTAGWSDAATFTPWTLYERYGDKAILQQQYGSMKGWVDFLFADNPDLITKDHGFITFADWLPMGPVTDKSYLGLCFWYRSTWILAQTAKLLGKQDDAEKYTALLKKLKASFDAHYLEHIPQTQTAYVIGIRFGLLPAAGNIDKLVGLIRANGNKLATGFMGTPYLMAALSDNGRADVAFDLLNQQEMPSWLYMVNKGAKTMWECWDAIQPDGTIKDYSLNHYAFGSVGSWMYENIAGIKPLLPGYRKVQIKPLVGGGLTWAKGNYLSAYGKISTSWQLNSGVLTLDVSIPKGITAEVFVPGENGSHLVGQGHYVFKSKN